MVHKPMCTIEQAAWIRGHGAEWNEDNRSLFGWLNALLTTSIQGHCTKLPANVLPYLKIWGRHFSWYCYTSKLLQFL